MFLNYIKNLFLKRILKKQLRNVKNVFFNCPVIKIGLIIDHSRFFETDALKQEIINKGIKEDNIKIILYRDNLSNKENNLQPAFSLKDLNVTGNFTQQALNDFISDQFDLLISYYNEEKPFLLLLTNISKAKFKTGFFTIDKRLNHLLINTNLEDYKGFTNELFKYLKILNKI